MSAEHIRSITAAILVCGVLALFWQGCANHHAEQMKVIEMECRK